MPLAVNPLHPLFAAEMLGADLRGPPSRELIAAVEHAMDTHAVLVVRTPGIGDDDHVRFSRAFGPLELPPALGTRVRHRMRPELFDASNLDDEGKVLTADSPRRQYNRANETFHTDSSFNDLPTKWSLLLAHVVPAEAGNTELVDTRVVYEDLPDKLKSVIEPLEAEHYLWHSREQAGFTATDEMRRAVPPVRHRLVRNMPNGRRALYIGAHASHVIGWPVEKGRQLLATLLELASQPKYVYSHRWRSGDLLIWDNRCTLHRAGEFEGLRLPRDLRRTTINEHGPERAATDR